MLAWSPIYLPGHSGIAFSGLLLCLSGIQCLPGLLWSLICLPSLLCLVQVSYVNLYIHSVVSHVHDYVQLWYAELNTTP